MGNAETVTRPKRAYHRRAAPKRTDADSRGVGVGHAAGPATNAEPAREQRRDTPEHVTRSSRFDLQASQFSIPEHCKKPGWDYEYKAITVLGQPVSGSDLALYHRQGWRAEKAKDWPDLCPPGYQGETVDEGGQRLYGRPMSLSVEAKSEDHKAAEQQRMDRLRAAAGGDIKGGGGLRDIKGVVPQTLQIEVEGEVGTYKK